MAISYFDAHCDTLSRCCAAGERVEQNGGHIDIERGSAFTHYAQVFACFCDPTGGQCDAAFLAQTQLLEDTLRACEGRIMRCRDASDLETAEREGKIAALLSVEGAEQLGCDPGRLDAASELGVKMINMTWNHANRLSGSCMSPGGDGLSSAGRDFAAQAQERGILIDVSHLSDAGFWDLVKMTRLPIIASHSNSRSVCAHRRNLTDDMFRAILDSGGFVGLNLYAYFLEPDGNATLDTLIAHLEHFLSLGGENALGFGCDFDGCERLPDGVSGVQDIEKIYEALKRRGYDDALLGRLFYDNLKRILFGSIK